MLKFWKKAKTPQSSWRTKEPTLLSMLKLKVNSKRRKSPLETIYLSQPLLFLRLLNIKIQMGRQMNRAEWEKWPTWKGWRKG